MDDFQTRAMRPLAVLLAVALAAGMLAACSANRPRERTLRLSPNLSVTLHGAYEVSAKAAPKSFVSSLARQLPVKLLAPAEQVTFRGELPAGAAVLTWHVDSGNLPSGVTPFVASLDSSNGHWTTLPGSYDRQTGTITEPLHTDPVLAPLGWINSQIEALLKGAILGIFALSGTGVYPQCSSYDVPITDSHPAEASIAFCAQPVGFSKVLVKLASMRPYPVDVTYPAGTNVGPSVLSRPIGRGPGQTILGGLAEMDATVLLSPGHSAQIPVRLDGAAMAAGLLGVAETLAAKLGGKPKAILDAFENAKCMSHAEQSLDSLPDPSLQDAQDAGAAILECAGQALENSKNVAAMIGAAVTFAASLAGDAIFAAWAVIDKLMRDSDHVLTVQRPASPSPGPAKCGAVNDSLIGAEVEVTVIKGAVSCPTAMAIVNTYYNHPPEPPSGSGGFVQIGSWLCSSTSGAANQQTGHGGDCYETQGSRISIGKP